MCPDCVWGNPSGPSGYSAWFDERPGIVGLYPALFPENSGLLTEWPEENPGILEENTGVPELLDGCLELLND